MSVGLCLTESRVGLPHANGRRPSTVTAPLQPMTHSPSFLQAVQTSYRAFHLDPVDYHL